MFRPSLISTAQDTDDQQIGQETGQIVIVRVGDSFFDHSFRLKIGSKFFVHAKQIPEQSIYIVWLAQDRPDVCRGVFDQPERLMLF